MNGKLVTKDEKENIRLLRQTGHSLSEIKKATGRGIGTIHLITKNTSILPQYLELWEKKRGASTHRAVSRWNSARVRAEGQLSQRFKINEYLLIATCLYWGEGAKRDFSFTNSDPEMIRVFTRCLNSLNIPLNRFRVSVRLYEDMNVEKVVNFWAKTIGVDIKDIRSINILHGKKQGKLEYGMCRIRITKGQDIFKLLQSAVKVITVRL